MYDDIAKARECMDSVGGVVECAITNVPAGIGSPMFEGLENTIAQLVFGIPAVKGIEFGAGFNASKCWAARTTTISMLTTTAT